MFSLNTFFPGRSAVSYKTNMKRLKVSIHKHYLLVLQQCCKQMEFIFAHRMRRCQQIILLYSKWWDELKLKLILENMKKQVAHRKKNLLGSTVVSCLNTKKENVNIDYSLIKDTEFSRYLFLIYDYYLKFSPLKKFKFVKQEIFNFYLDNIQT